MKGSNADDDPMEEMEERQLMSVKKKRKRAAEMVVSIRGSGTTTLNQLPEELQSEILVRIPGMKLHQCMCVSKGWCSIIRDPLFLRAHLKHQPHGSFFVSLADGRDYKGDSWFPDIPFGLTVFYSPLLPVQAPADQVQVQNSEPFLSLVNLPSFASFRGVTKMVNGLICAYGIDGAMVCSVGTQEFMWFPQITGFLNTLYEDYYFGYHPGDEVYKMLKISKTGTQQEFHILTLGRDSCWRKLDIELDGSDRLPAGNSCLCGGVLYWVLHGMVDQFGLISFDLKAEKFLSIDPPRDPIFHSRRCWWVMGKFMGKLSLFAYGFKRCPSPELLGIFTLEKYNYRGCSSWSRHEIPVPPEFQSVDRFCVQPVGNLPTGEILLTTIYFWKPADADSVCIYSYDHRTNKFKRFMIGNIPQAMIRSVGLAYSLCYINQETLYQYLACLKARGEIENG